MSRLKLIIPVVIILLLSCHSNRTHIVITDNDNSTDIKCWGDVQFSADTASIKSISPGGYVAYQKNEKRLRAERSNNGEIYLEVYNNGKQVSIDENAKLFVAKAVKEMMARHVGRIVSE